MTLAVSHSQRVGMNEVGAGGAVNALLPNPKGRTSLEARFGSLISPFRIVIITKLAGKSDSRCTIVLSDVECIDPYEDYDGENHYSALVREFVRELLSKGKKITCHVDRFMDSGRALGTIIIHPDNKLEDDININKELIKNGYAKMKVSTKTPRASPAESMYFKNEYIALQDAAKADRTNFWGLNATEARLLRDKARIPDCTPEEFLSKYQGQKLKAYVSKAYSLVSYQLIIFVQSSNPRLIPYFKMKVELAGVCLFPPIDGENGSKNSCTNTSMSFLQDSVLLKTTTFCPNTIRIVGSRSVVCGYIKYPDSKDSLSYILLLNGYVMLYPRTAEINEATTELYTRICNQSSNNKLGYWGELCNKHNMTVKLEPDRPPFKAKVLQAVNGSTILVKDKETNAEKKINLTGIKSFAPAAKSSGDNDSSARPYDDSMRSREELIKLVGSEVDVTVDYDYVDQNNKARFLYGTVRAQNIENVSLHLLSKGLADVNYSKIHLLKTPPKIILACEKSYRIAAARGCGIHSRSQINPLLITDYTATNHRSDQIAKLFDYSKSYLGLIESIIFPTKLKVYFPKLKCIVALNIANIYVPKKSTTITKSSDKHNDIRDEAIAFMRDTFLQRNVLVSKVTSLEDKKNTALRMITAEFHLPQNNNSHCEDLAAILLSLGYALPLHTRSSSDKKLISAHDQATENARQQKKGLWAHKNTQDAGKSSNAEGHKGTDASRSKGYNIKSAFLTHIDKSDLTPHLQIFSSADEKECLEKKFSKLNSPEYTHKQLTLDPGTCAGTVCCAKDTTDDRYYRVEILEEIEPSVYKVIFIDYGNTGSVQASDVTLLPDDLTTDLVPPLAVKYHLAYIDDTAPFDEYVHTFIEVLTTYTRGGQIKCRIDHNSEMKRDEVILFDSDGSTINEKLIIEGVAPLQKWCMVRNTRGGYLTKDAFEIDHADPKSASANILNLPSLDILHRFKSAQEIAKTSRRNMWISGDFLDYEPPVKSNTRRHASSTRE